MEKHYVPSARRAACVVLLRPTPDESAPGNVQIYLVRRSKHLGFLGGFHSFPGGAVDKVDAHANARPNTHTSASSPILHAEPNAHTANEVLHIQAAALRELFEETGVLAVTRAAACNTGGDAAHSPPRPIPISIPEPERRALRQAMERSSEAWLPFLHDNNLLLDTRRLIPFGRWRTPPFTQHRFDALYFAMWLPDGEAPEVWPGELDDGFWITPEAAIAQHEAGTLFISYPVLETLRLFVTHGLDVQATSHVMQERGGDAYPHAGGEMIAGIHVVPLRTFTLPPATHTNCYVLGQQELVVVDPATPIEEEQQLLLKYLNYLCGKGSRVKEIWLTHHHKDHVGGAAWLRQQLGVGIAAHRETAEAMGKHIPVDRFIEDGEVTHLPRDPAPPAEWVALHTPGHARGHLCFYERKLGSLLTGDNVLGIGTVLIAPPEGNMTQYLASLQRLLTLKLGMLFPAHGPPIATAREKIEAYITHRRRREEAIVRALQNSTTPLAPREIVPMVYTDVPEAVYPLAELNVKAHVEKLVAEGRVRWVTGGDGAEGPDGRGGRVDNRLVAC